MPIHHRSSSLASVVNHASQLQLPHASTAASTVGNLPAMFERSMGPETMKKYTYWRIILQRGHDKVHKLKRSKEGQAQLLAESLPARKDPRHHWQPRNAAAEKDSGPALLPAYLHETSTDTCPTSPASPVKSTKPGRRRRSFLSFPPEVRNLIYQSCVDYPICRDLFDTYYVQKDKQKSGKGKQIARDWKLRSNVQLNTPTILLLCKQISREALSMLRTRTFILDRISPWIMGYNSPLPLSDFISKPTLQSLRHVELRIALGQGSQGSGIVWVKVLKDLLRILSESHMVVELKVMIKLVHIDHWGTWFTELRYYELLIDMLEKWEMKYAHKPGTVQFEHWVIDYTYAYRTGFRNPLVRVYPDPDLWVGDILEFL